MGNKIVLFGAIRLAERLANIGSQKPLKCNKEWALIERGRSSTEVPYGMALFFGMRTLVDDICTAEISQCLVSFLTKNAG